MYVYSSREKKLLGFELKTFFYLVFHLIYFRTFFVIQGIL